MNCEARPALGPPGLQPPGAEIAGVSGGPSTRIEHI